MIRAGGFDEFGQTRTRQFWEAQHICTQATFGTSRNLEFDFKAGC